MTVLWSKKAKAEFDNILAYIASQDISAARLIVERVLKAEQYIELFPEAAPYDEKSETYDRYIPKTRIILTYTVRENEVRILRVWHTSQDRDER